MPNNAPSPNEQKATQDRIMADLLSGDATRQLSAIRDLERLNFSSAAILRQLEQLAIQDNPVVRKAALDALDLQTNLFVSSKLTSLTRSDRGIVLREIENWEENDLVEPHRADVLRRRYNFDARTGRPVQGAAAATAAAPVVESKPVEAPSVPVAKPEAVTVGTPPARPAPVPAAPRPSLMEVLLSETAIRIYLYLGALFVIAAAAYFAALPQTRLPTLTVSTIIFASGAVGLRKRLPQPGFALAIVFSFLLPIDANVLGQTLNLSARSSAVYWTIVFLLMTVIWALGTWFYESRLFSVASFVSLALTALRFSEIFDASTNWNIFSVALVNILALAAVRFLKSWKDQNFALPLFLLAQLTQVILLAISFSAAVFNTFSLGVSAGSWIAAALTWILAASFYVASDLLIPFLLFPWAAAASLFLVPWLTLSAFNASAAAYVTSFAVWGIVHAFASEFVKRANRPALTKYHFPLLAWSLPPFIVAIIWGFANDVTYGFAAFLCAGIAYTLVNLMRPRWYVWLTALLAGLGAYFSFFALPFLKSVNVVSGYQMLGAVILLLTPELFFKDNFSFTRNWNWPPLVLGTIIGGLNLLTTLILATSTISFFGSSAVIMGAYALLFAAYALRFQRPFLGYFAATSASFSVVFALHHFDLDWWLPALTLLAAAYYIPGYLLARREQTRPWSSMLINSGLALGALLSLVALFSLKETGGWYALIVAALFIVEMYTRQKKYFEWCAEILMSIALVLILHDFDISESSYILFGLSLVWLISDATVQRTFKDRHLPNATRIITGVLTGAALLTIGSSRELAAGATAVCFTVYSFVFAAYALAYREARLGYLSTFTAVAAIIFALDHFARDWWLPALTLLAVAYYVCGYLLTPREQTKTWGAMLINSGLALGTLFSLVSIFTLKETGGWYALVIAALFLVEMYTRRNGALEWFIEILSCVALILILNDFNIHKVTYYLMGLSLVLLACDATFQRTFKYRKLPLIIRFFAGAVTAIAVMFIYFQIEVNSSVAAVCFAVYTAAFAIYAWLSREPRLGYLVTASAAMAAHFTLAHYRIETWLPVFTGLSAGYYIAGYFLRKQSADWARMLRYSGLALGALITFNAVTQLEPTGGWYAAFLGGLFVLEMFTSRNGWFEAGVHVFFSAAVFLILHDFKVDALSYNLLAISLVWLIGDAALARTFKERSLAVPVRAVGNFVAGVNAFGLLTISPAKEAGVSFGVYAVVYAFYAWFYKRPMIGYASTVSLALAVFFGMKAAEQGHWLLPLIAVAVVYYVAGFFLRRSGQARDWDTMLLYSGLGLGTLVAAAAPFQSGGLEKAIPLAITATFYAAEAFARKSVWLGFPANALYLASYFVILNELEVDEPQFFTVGAAALGLFQHYLLTRAGHKTTAFITGLVSQLVLLGASYFQMINTGELKYFIVLFFQALAVLAYGIIIRSRSLVIAPIGFVVLAILTILYNTVKDLAPVLIIGITGLILLGVGILAVVMRERITNLAERFGDWDA